MPCSKVGAGPGIASAGEGAPVTGGDQRLGTGKGPTYFHRRNLGSGDMNGRHDYISEANLQLLERRR